MPDQLETLKQVVSAKNFEIIIVASGKGGVGKSVIAANFAVALAKNQKSVLLFDADVGFANADILLGLTTKNTLRDYLVGKMELKDVLYPTSYGIWLLSSGTDVGDLIAFRSESKLRLMDDFMKIVVDMDYAVVDTGAGFTEELLSFYEAADKLFMITTPEPTALINVYTLAKMLATKGIFPELYLIMNQSRNTSKDTQVLERFSYVLEKFAGWTIAEKLIVREDAGVSASVLKQIPFIETQKHSQPAQAIQRLSKMVLKSQSYEDMEPDGFFVKFKKLFGIK
ncbi:MAG TPA: P-loop NTPase [Thermotogota bacterium]|jgi:flagellar biosynthesis protein FlhG|nr:P-loop NTPase [Thermotogota bacterium]NLZ14160.1 MinD/ParA family protein [Thermotogaceae bacterium]MDD8041282.1 P-loop NTPase [Thermotogota bacterium]MDD8053920.1 P-loop NTPase [Thermotogota bacterium]HNR63223.1 P-loop NTPase [Thermotogota bacterium]